MTEIKTENIRGNSEFTVSLGRSVVLGIEPKSQDGKNSMPVKIDLPYLVMGDASRSMLEIGMDRGGSLEFNNIGNNMVYVFGIDQKNPSVACISPGMRKGGPDFEKIVGRHPVIIVETAKKHRLLIKQESDSQGKDVSFAIFDASMIKKISDINNVFNNGPRIHYRS